MRAPALSALLLAAGLPIAAADAQQFAPRCYFWDPPRSTAPMPNPNFSPIVKVYLAANTSAADAAAHPALATIDLFQNNDKFYFGGAGGVGPSARQILHRWHDPNQDGIYTDSWIAGGFTLFLQNAGTTNFPSTILGDQAQGSPVDQDKVDVDVFLPIGTDDPFNTAGSENFRRRQPWMVHGRAQSETFWTSFAQALDAVLQASPQLPEPIRLHQDMETPLTDAFNERGAYLLFAMQHEDPSATFPNQRWTDEPVPGFGGLSMKNLWDAVKGTNAAFTSRPYPLVTSGTHANYYAVAPDGPDAFFPYGSNYDNKALYIWYASITQRAMAAVLDETCADPLRALWPDLKASNYGYSYFTPKANQDFGWYQPYPGTAPFARTGPRGETNYANHGYLFAHPSQNLLFPDPDSPYRWLLDNNTRPAGELSSPVLYATGEEDIANNNFPLSSWIQFRQNDPYLKNHPLDATRWQVSLRRHRWMLESVIASIGDDQGGAPWEKVTPWIPCVGFDAALSGPDTYRVTADDVNRVLSLARAKRIGELLVFNPREANIPDGYSPFDTVYRQVCDPYLTDFVLDWYPDTTFCVGENPSLPGHADLARLSDSNPRWTQANPSASHLSAPHVVEVCSAPGVASWDLANQVIATTHVIDGPFPEDEILRLTLEAEVTIVGKGETGEAGCPDGLPADLTVTGAIQFAQTTGGWYELTFGDEVTGHPTRYGFWAPLEWTVQGDRVSVLMRRTFDICGPSSLFETIIDSAGDAWTRLFVKAESATDCPFPSDAVFSVKWDLVQLTRAPRPQSCPDAEPGPIDPELQLFMPPGENTGAANPVAAFMQALTQNARAADANRDGRKDAADIAAFIDRYFQAAGKR